MAVDVDHGAFLTSQRWAYLMLVESLVAKLKICVVHFQVVLLLVEVYGVPLPLVWHESMQVFEVMRVFVG